MIHSSGVILGFVWKRTLQRAERKAGMTDRRPQHSAETGLHLCPVPRPGAAKPGMEVLKMGGQEQWVKSAVICN